MSDAVEVAAESLHQCDRGEAIKGALSPEDEDAREDYRRTARAVLRDLRANGWRIVRGDDLGGTECFAGGPNVHIDEEWTP